MVFLSSKEPVIAYRVVALFDPFEVVIGPHPPRMVIPHAAMSETSSNGPERFRPTGIERYVLPHLLVLSVADPSVISPSLSPPGRPFQCPTALTRPSEFTAPGDRTVTDDATCKHGASAGTFDVSETFYATTLRLLRIVFSR